MKYLYGIDIGGTTVKMGLFGEDGTLKEKWEIKTRTEENGKNILPDIAQAVNCLLYTSPSPRDRTRSRMPSSA